MKDLKSPLLINGNTVSPSELSVVNASRDTLLKALNFLENSLDIVPPEFDVGFFITNDMASFIKPTSSLCRRALAPPKSCSAPSIASARLV